VATDSGACILALQPAPATADGAVAPPPEADASGTWIRLCNLKTSADAQVDSRLTAMDGVCGLCWSPNGRFLLAVTGRRVLTVWDLLMPAADAAGEAEASHDARLDRLVAKPAVALTLFVPDSSPLDGDANPQAATAVPKLAVTERDPRFCGAAWTADGCGVVLSDSTGRVVTVKIGSHIRRYTEERVDITWLAPAAVTALAEADEAAASLEVAARPLPLEALALPLPVPPKRQRAAAAATQAAMTDDAAAAASTFAVSMSDLAAPATASAALGGAGSKRQRDDDDADSVVRDVSALKRSYGFVDTEEAEGEDGLGGMRRIDPAEALAAAAAAAGGAGALAKRGRFVDAASEERFVRKEDLLTFVLRASRHVRELHGFVTPQPPFQPGATRFPPHGKRRFLSWTPLGAMLLLKGENGAQGRVVVEFSDSANRNQTATDVNNFTVGAFNEQGAVLACPYRPPLGLGEEGTPSVLVYRSFRPNLVAVEKGWSVELKAYRPRILLEDLPPRHPLEEDDEESAAGAGQDEVDGAADAEVGGSASLGKKKKQAAIKAKRVLGAAGAATGLTGDEDDDFVLSTDTSSAAESAVCVAIGDGWCAVATNQEVVRIFRTSAIQEQSIALGGTPVAMVGQGALLAVAYHAAEPSGHRQRLAVSVFKISYTTAAGYASASALLHSLALPQKLVTVPLPLRRDVTVQWLGFAANGMLTMVDTLGCLHALVPGMNWQWSPMLETKPIAEAGGPAAMATEGSSKSQHDAKDFYWPVGVIAAPVGTLPPSKDRIDPKAVENLLNSPALYLQAVLCKGGASHPSASANRPLVDTIPLQQNLVDTGYDAIDDLFIQQENMRSQRLWSMKQGLTTEGARSITAHASSQATAAILNGNSNASAAEDVQRAVRDEAQEDREAAKGLDTLVLYGIHSAIFNKNERDEPEPLDTRAMELGYRLHTEKSFVGAYQKASKRRRTMVANMYQQLESVRVLETALTVSAESAPAVNNAPPADFAAPAPAPAAGGGFGLAKSVPRSNIGSSMSGARSNGEDMRMQSDAMPADPFSRGSSAFGAADAAAAGGPVSAPNPFARRNMGSPERSRRPKEGLDVLAMASPPPASGLNRNSSIAEMGRNRRTGDGL
jgi:hypothetical protein